MEWINKPKNINNYQGFVYKITCLKTGKYYIGQKSFWKPIRRKPLKGKKRVRKDRVERNWKNYYGSCKKLLEDIEINGKDNYKREILYLCVSKSEMSYKELVEQVNYNVLDDDKSYNGIINVRLTRTK